MSLDLISSLDTRFFADEISSQHIHFGKLPFIKCIQLLYFNIRTGYSQSVQQRVRSQGAFSNQRFKDFFFSISASYIALVVFFKPKDLTIIKHYIIYY
jgi:hypothetical protein